ncbi:MAG: hypothetical protein JWN45_3234 [Acidobacteriaceae bacterium]|nr:hypothetical protein [Acidobacteriaceae bacterium]
MAERRKTPLEKKEVDYIRQRRTHWDSDKAARKAIPAAKRRAHKEIRKQANEIVRAATRLSPLGTDDLDEIASQKLVSKPTMTSDPKAYGRGITLGENVVRQQNRRSREPEQRTTNPVSIHRLSLFVNRKYTPELKRALLEYMQGIEHWRTGLGSNIGPSNRLFVDVVSELAAHRNSKLVQSFWKDEPGWRKRFELWIKKLDQQEQ